MQIGYTMLPKLHLRALKLNNAGARYFQVGEYACAGSCFRQALEIMKSIHSKKGTRKAPVGLRWTRTVPIAPCSDEQSYFVFLRAFEIISSGSTGGFAAELTALM
jgi:hypothetical protein